MSEMTNSSKELRAEAGYYELKPKITHHASQWRNFYENSAFYFISLTCTEYWLTAFAKN